MTTPPFFATARIISSVKFSGRPQSARAAVWDTITGAARLEDLDNRPFRAAGHVDDHPHAIALGDDPSPEIAEAPVFRAGQVEGRIADGVVRVSQKAR